jgi:predicted HTH domain antitoxin
MAVTFELPADVEQKLRAQNSDLAREAKEAYALELFRRGKLTHFELSQVLGLDRVKTDALLKRHGIYKGSLTLDDLEADRKTLERVLGHTRH